MANRFKRLLMAVSAFALVGAATLAEPVSSNATTLPGVHEYSLIQPYPPLPVSNTWCQGNLRHFILSGGTRTEQPAVSFSMPDGRWILLVAKDDSRVGLKLICRQGTVVWTTGRLPPPPPA